MNNVNDVKDVKTVKDVNKELIWEMFFSQLLYIPFCSPNTCNGVFNPNITTFQSNCAEGLHFSAFH